MKLTRFATPVIVALSMISVTGCGKKGSSPASTSGSSSPTRSSSSSNDYATPTLTEDKMVKFVDSMKEEKNPLEFVFKQGGGMRNVADLKMKEIEFNAYARKYGFKDYTEYMDTWGRVMVGQMELAGAKMMKGLAESTQQSIANAEEQLKKPNLNAEMRKMYEEQIVTGKQSLADMQKPADKSGLNAADLALVEKYSPQIDEAVKKYKAKS